MDTHDISNMSREELERRFKSLLHVRDRVVHHAHLLQELALRRRELEDENATLSAALHEIELTRAAYVDLYDFAPVAYYTFDRLGCIRQVNLTGATMLGVERSQLIGQPFALLIGAPNAHPFWVHLGRCRDSRAALVSELSIQRRGRELSVRCASVPVFNATGEVDTFRTVFTEMGDLRCAREEARLAREAELQIRLTHDRVEDATDRVLGFMRSTGSNLDALGRAVVEAARLLVNADHATLSFTTPPCPVSGARFVSGTPQIRVSDHQLILQQVEHLDLNLGELSLTRVNEKGFSPEERQSIGLFARRVAPLLELARLRPFQDARSGLLPRLRSPATASG